MNLSASFTPCTYSPPFFFGLSVLFMFSDLEFHLFCCHVCSSFPKCISLTCPLSFSVFNFPPFTLWSVFFSVLLTFCHLFFPWCSSSSFFFSFCWHQRVTSLFWSHWLSQVSVVSSAFIPLSFNGHWLPYITNLEVDPKNLKNGWPSTNAREICP